jgi:hypothetical protein
VFFNKLGASIIRMLNSLATLAVLAPDHGIRQLATMIMWLLMYQWILKVRGQLKKLLPPPLSTTRVVLLHTMP